MRSLDVGINSDSLVKPSRIEDVDSHINYRGWRCLKHGIRARVFYLNGKGGANIFCVN
jgi:hypothetical protein